jgi:iron(III) transport system substrate-binding protein
MSRIGRFSLLVVFLMLFAWAPAGAQSRLEKAKKEGKVVWYSSLTIKVSQKVCNLFNSKNLGIECILHRSGSSKIFNRYRREARGKIFRADVIHTSNIGQFITMHDKLKFIAPYKAEGADRFLPAFKTDDGRWTVLRSSVMVPVYNTKLVKAEQAPTSYKDLLKPEWKNKLVIADPNYGGFATITMISLVNLYGLEFYEKLMANNPRRWGSASGTLTLVERGEVAMSTGSTAYSTYNHIKRGEPIKMAIPKEGVPFVRSPVAVLSNAPHPNAARVFVDFVLSLEVQQLLANNGLYVGHPDVKLPKGQVPLSSFKLINIPASEISSKSKSMRKSFKKIFSGIKLEGAPKKKKKKKKTN